MSRKSEKHILITEATTTPRYTVYNSSGPFKLGFCRTPIKDVLTISCAIDVTYFHFNVERCDVAGKRPILSVRPTFLR